MKKSETYIFLDLCKDYINTKANHWLFDHPGDERWPIISEFIHWLSCDIKKDMEIPRGGDGKSYLEAYNETKQ